MKHRLSFGDVPFYEAALLKLIQKYPPPSSVVLITIHEAGKGAGGSTVRYTWPPSNAADIAKLVAHKIVQAYTDRAGKVFDGVIIDFDHPA
jgi:hypothetical protein